MYSPRDTYSNPPSSPPIQAYAGMVSSNAAYLSSNVSQSGSAAVGVAVERNKGVAVERGRSLDYMSVPVLSYGVTVGVVGSTGSDLM